MRWQFLALLTAVLVCATELTAQETTAKPAVATTPTIQGTFTIGGKTFKLIHAVAYEAKVFDDYMIHVLVSSEPIAVDKLKAALKEGNGTDDKFITFQPQVKLTFKKSGEIGFCNANAEGHSFSISGGSLTGELALKDGRVIGKSGMKNEEGKKNETTFDVQFNLELIAAVIVPDDKPSKKEKSKSMSKGRDIAGSGTSKSKKGEVAEDAVNVYDLPIPADATDIDRKKLVEHIHFNSPSSTTTVTDFLVKQFDAQKWSKDGSDLVGKKSTILKRNKGSSSLTIFVKPDEAGSTVTIMAHGLSWEQKESSPEGKPKDDKPSAGILASEFPLPEKATDVERDATVKMVTCYSSSSAKELVDFYGKSLKKLGWKEKKDETVVVELVETGLMNFTMGKDSIQIVIQDGQPKGRTRLMILGSGLKWTSDKEK